jgi:hypothetical protein
MNQNIPINAELTQEKNLIINIPNIEKNNIDQIIICDSTKKPIIYFSNKSMFDVLKKFCRNHKRKIFFLFFLVFSIIIILLQTGVLNNDL